MYRTRGDRSGVLSPRVPNVLDIFSDFKPTKKIYENDSSCKK